MDEWYIKTSRLGLRILTARDKDAFFGYRSLEEVSRYQSWRPTRCEEAEEFIAANLKTSPGTAGAWLQLAICLPDDHLIGDIGIHFLEHDQLELGYTLSPAYQGQGLAFEAVSAVIDLAFREYRKHRITASVDPANGPSIRLLQRLGFRQEGYFVKSFWSDGRWADDCLFALLKEDWEKAAKDTRPDPSESMTE